MQGAASPALSSLAPQCAWLATARGARRRAVGCTEAGQELINTTQAGTCFTCHRLAAPRQPHEQPASHSTQAQAGREQRMIAWPETRGSAPGQPLAVR